MTNKEKAEAYVRQALPELMELSFGCEVELLLGDLYGDRAKVEYECGKCRKHKLSKNCDMDCEFDDAISVVQFGYLDEATEWVFLDNGKEFRIIGHPIQLQHWLRVLERKMERYYVDSIGQCENKWNGEKLMQFNLTTGQPATEADYQAFNNIVGV